MILTIVFFEAANSFQAYCYIRQVSNEKPNTIPTMDIYLLEKGIDQKARLCYFRITLLSTT